MFCDRLPQPRTSIESSRFDQSNTSGITRHRRRQGDFSRRQPMSPEVEEDLMATCAAVLAIRMDLMKALGYPVEDDK
ncbi:hypothetical protein RLO149_c028790 [Roseobacter litoralis Och 149]|uniref:Uncharacterized protein n=1 Tax=Roseobacter litoralis (strain ATCC 49566 / DSM 6996 / JCM 21268 / NBRC 15278 / OCh 149) TaxID=391595 RepID=F7ZGA7_ROSLO|nr:hypothetical protein RLO149_c028790 [Roseobacter litoralis Och 149]